MFQVDLELHPEFSMAKNNAPQVQSSPPKLKRLLEIILSILTRDASLKK
jgi:hypothetical protein